MPLFICSILCKGLTCTHHCTSLSVLQDAMSKTIPIWAAVLNRAVARVRLHDAQKEQRRRSYTTQDGEVLTPVADTQTSISVRTDEPCIVSSCSSAATHAPQLQHQQQSQQQHVQQQQHALVQQQQRQQHSLAQQQHASSTCSSAAEVEELLLDCMGDSCMELLSAGLSVAVARPSTPDQPHAQHMYSQLQRPPNYAGVGGSPSSRAAALLRSMSLHISPQPSLQEWLDETDVRHRLALLHHDCGISPKRRTPRVSCHTIGRESSVDASAALGAAAEVPAVLFASSAPASSCLLGSSPPHSGGCVQAFCVDEPIAAAAVGPEQQQQEQQHFEQQHQQALLSAAAPPAAVAGVAGSQPAAAGFSIGTGDAAEPVTPRLGCCGALSAEFNSIHEALQDEQQQPAAAVAASSCGMPALQQLCQLEQHEVQWGLQLPANGPPTVGSAVSVSGGDLGAAAGESCADFAFPSPHQLAQSVASSLAEAGSSVCRPGTAAGHGSSMSSSCGASGLALPEMPVVVLNGTSHQPGDAASILDIWRSTDLEDVATLPGISDFKPGVYHMPAEQDVDDEEAADFGFGLVQQQQQKQQQHVGSSWGVVDGQQVAAAAAAASLGSSTDSSWMDEETGVGYDGLCAFAPPPVAVPAAACAAADDSNSACSASSAARLRPGSPNACSSCSHDSELSAASSRSAGADPARAAADANDVAAAAAAAAAEVAWDTGLHLPLWVPAHERQAMEAKLDGWVERLLEVGADVRGLAARLRKPLRPLWVTQDSLIWTNQVGGLEWPHEVLSPFCVWFCVFCLQAGLVALRVLCAVDGPPA